MDSSVWTFARFFRLVAIGFGVLGHTYALAITPSTPDIARDFGKLPLAFEENRGQVNGSVKFLSRGPGYQLFLTAQEAVMVYSKDDIQKSDSAVVRMRFDGANPNPDVQGMDPLDFKTNYFGGGESAQQVTDIVNHARVKYKGIYPGIDVVYYGSQQRLEYDLIVAPNANPRLIKLHLGGADKVRVSARGDLILTTAAGEIVHHKPIAYQDIRGIRKQVNAQYKLASADQSVSFALGAYDKSQPLVIDPILSYSSYLYGSHVAGIALDSNGNIYIVGSTKTASLPVVGGYSTTLNGTQDAYAIKIDPTGTKLLYATYLGARRGITSGLGIAVDGAGSAYISGLTDSANYPVTSGAYQTTFATGASFLTKLAAAGNALAYSTFINGSIASIAVNSAGNVYMTGTSSSLAATAGAFQTAAKYSPSPFVAKLNTTGTGMGYLTYLGGTLDDEAKGIAIDSSGNAYVTGFARSTNFPTANAYQPQRNGGGGDAFVAKLNPNGTALVYSTYLGGLNDDGGYAVAVDAAGQAYVTGMTSSDNFPVTAGVFQPQKGYPDWGVSNAFITKLSSSGATLEYSSFLGGRWCLTATVYECFGFTNGGVDFGTAVAVDAAGFAYLGGVATSVGFPLTDSIHPMGEGGNNARSPFVAKISPKGDQKIYSVVLGARTQDARLNGLVLDANANVIGAGFSNSAVFPFTGAPLATTGANFIFKLSTGKISTRISTSKNPVSASQPIVFTALVNDVRLGGQVTFMDGNVALGVVPVVDGAASITSMLEAGIHKIAAIYSGDGTVSPPVFQVVNSQ